MRCRVLALALLLPILAPTAAPGSASAEPPALPILRDARERPATRPPPAEPAQAKRPKLQVGVDLSKVDLAGHKLEVTLSHTADKVKIKVFGQSGAVLAEVEKAFGGASPGTVLAMSWTPASEEEVLKIEVWGYDTDGFYSGVAVTTWHIQIEHEELNFDTDSDVIRAGEAPKLDASLQKINDAVAKNPDVGKPTLYVRGHTDTVGTTDHNLTLSRARARAIAGWFRSHGLKMPIAYEGVGKAGQFVKTADQVDEPKNRRVEYILAVVAPPLPAGELSWKPL
jgi:outer membrane protein OmpA-like peptidoglycan-associated protein